MARMAYAALVAQKGLEGYGCVSQTKRQTLPTSLEGALLRFTQNKKYENLTVKKLSTRPLLV